MREDEADEGGGGCGRARRDQAAPADDPDEGPDPEADGELGAVEIAQRTGVSRGTARRYLEYLAATGAIELTLRYGATGRPEHLYRWADPVGRGV